MSPAPTKIVALGVELVPISPLTRVGNWPFIVLAHELMLVMTAAVAIHDRAVFTGFPPNGCFYAYIPVLGST
ncbi:hypothetical protein D3C72_1951420 [compost metagenome]